MAHRAQLSTELVADRYTSFVAGLNDGAVFTQHGGRQAGVEGRASPADAYVTETSASSPAGCTRDAAARGRPSECDRGLEDWRIGTPVHDTGSTAIEFYARNSESVVEARLDLEPDGNLARVALRDS